MYIYTILCKYVYICVYVYVYICVYVCIYIWGLYVYMNMSGELKWIYPIIFRCFIEKKQWSSKHEDLSMGKSGEFPPEEVDKQAWSNVRNSSRIMWWWLGEMFFLHQNIIEQMNNRYGFVWNREICPSLLFLHSEHDDNALDFRLNRSTLFSGKPILVYNGVQRWFYIYN